MRLGWALATTLGCLLFFALVGVAGAETLLNSGVAPGALEPPPVDPAIEAEAEAHMKERHTRGVGATWQDGADVELYPALQGGRVGWCLAVHGSAHDSASCPVAPRQAEIAYERWESSTGGTQGFVLAAAGLDGVAVNQGAIVPLTPVPGLSGTLGGAVVTIPAPFPWSWSDEFEPVVHGITSSPWRGFSVPPFAPAVQLPATPWRAPQSPPSGACSLRLHSLPGAKARSGYVVASVPAEPGIAGGGFSSCVDTVFSFQGSSLDAAVLLAADNPGAPPPPLPRARAIRGHRGLFAAPGRAGQILAKRVGNAWLAVEGGRGLPQRERLIGHLAAGGSGVR